MRVKNKTAKIQTLWIKDVLRGEDSTPVEVLPSEARELSEFYITDKTKTPNFDSIFEIEGLYRPLLEVKETPKVEEIKEESNLIEETTPVVETADVIEEKFICDICGAEFASARGLASHKNRSH